MTIKKVYGTIEKTEAMDDGTIKVYGFASSESVDSDGEVITAAAMKAAIPDYMKFGAVREMHDNKAAGTALEIEVQEDGRTWFGAHIVDPIAVKKVQAGVYKGFSIGGRVTKRDAINKTIIDGLNLVEVSLVDRPANPEAVMTMYKSDSVEDKPADEVVAETVADEEIHEQAAAENVEAEKTEAVEIEKAGSKFSADTSGQLAAIHDLIKQACTNLEAVGYQQNLAGDTTNSGGVSQGVGDADADKSEAAQALQKAAAISDELAKVSGELELLKAEKIATDDKLSKAEARVKELEALPVPAKGVLRSLEKSDDVVLLKADGDAKAQAVIAKAGAESDPLEIMKAIHRVGGKPIQ